jgi:hypothetical protein
LNCFHAAESQALARSSGGPSDSTRERPSQGAFHVDGQNSNSSLWLNRASAPTRRFAGDTRFHRGHKDRSSHDVRSRIRRNQRHRSRRHRGLTATYRHEAQVGTKSPIISIRPAFLAASTERFKRNDAYDVACLWRRELLPVPPVSSYRPIASSQLPYGVNEVRRDAGVNDASRRAVACSSYVVRG